MRWVAWAGVLLPIGVLASCVGDGPVASGPLDGGAAVDAADAASVDARADDADAHAGDADGEADANVGLDCTAIDFGALDGAEWRPYVEGSSGNLPALCNRMTSSVDCHLKKGDHFTIFQRSFIGESDAFPVGGRYKLSFAVKIVDLDSPLVFGQILERNFERIRLTAQVDGPQVLVKLTSGGQTVVGQPVALGTKVHFEIGWEGDRAPREVNVRISDEPVRTITLPSGGNEPSIIQFGPFDPASTGNASTNVVYSDIVAQRCR